MQSIVDLDKKLKMYIVQCKFLSSLLIFVVEWNFFKGQHQKRQLEQRKVVQKLMKDREQSLTDVCNDLRQIEDSLTTVNEKTNWKNMFKQLQQALNDAKFCLPSNDTETRSKKPDNNRLFVLKKTFRNWSWICIDLCTKNQLFCICTNELDSRTTIEEIQTTLSNRW